MLSRLLADHRVEIVARARAKALERLAPRSLADPCDDAVAASVDHLVGMLESSQELVNEASRRALEVSRDGLSIAQAIHGYCDVRQAVNELADERGWPLAPDDRHALDECLDEAVAHAVTSFVAEHDRSVERGHTEKMGELAHELRNLLSGAILAFRALERGSVGVGGSTSAVLGRSLTGLRELVDRSLAGVRLDAGIAAQEQVAMRALIHEVEIAAMMHAHARRVRLVVAPVARDVLVEVDRTTLGAAVMNLLQNAIKFTRPRGEVVLRAHAVGERVLIDVKDECGGLPPGKADELFRPFEQRGADRSGLGLGLSISRRAVAASGGELRVRDRPGRGCVFTIELPRFRARDLAGPAPSATRMRARRASSGS